MGDAAGSSGVMRRGLLLAGAGLAADGPGAAVAQDAATAPAGAVPSVPLVPPRTEFVYEAIVDIAPTLPPGASPLGERRMVPIAGGGFQGPRIRGKVLPGGADRQLVRKDGVRQLDALYEMQAEDGAIITVRNRVPIDDPAGRPRHAVSTLEITAPEGPHAWLNRAVHVGTLNSLRPERETVLVRVFKLV